MGRGLRAARPSAVVDGDRLASLSRLTRACDHAFEDLCDEVREGEDGSRSADALARLHARRIVTAIFRDELVSEWLPLPYSVLPGHGADPRPMIAAELYSIARLLDDLPLEDRQRIGWPGSAKIPERNVAPNEIYAWMNEPLLIWLTAHCQDIREAARHVVERMPSEEEICGAIAREQRAKRRLNIAYRMRYDQVPDIRVLAKEVTEAQALWRREQAIADLCQARARDYEMRYGALPAYGAAETCAAASCRILSRWWNWPSKERPPQLPDALALGIFHARSIHMRNYAIRTAKRRQPERLLEENDIAVVSLHPRVPQPITVVMRDQLKTIDRTALVVNLLATKVPPSLPCLNRDMQPRELTDSCSVPRPLSLATAVAPGTHLRLLTLGETPISTSLVEFRGALPSGDPANAPVDTYQDWRYRDAAIPELTAILAALPKKTSLDLIEHDLIVDAQQTWVLVRSGGPQDLYADEANSLYDAIQSQVRDASKTRLASG